MTNAPKKPRTAAGDPDLDRAAPADADELRGRADALRQHADELDSFDPEGGR